MLSVMDKPKRPDKKTARASVRQPTAITIRGSKEWRDWVDRGAEHCRTDSSKLIDIALAFYLKAQGFNDPAPKR